MDLYMAGAEHPEFSRLLEVSGYPFRLMSYFYFKQLAPAKREIVLAQAAGNAKYIMDSGLFSMMFGGEKEKVAAWTYDDHKRYAMTYIEQMQKIGWRHRIVECDVHRVLGIDEALRMREEVFDQCGFEVIYVWHLPETIEGLHKLARTRAHIALSVPELRGVAGRKELVPGASGRRVSVEGMLLRLIKEVRAAGSPTVHLLGNTESALMGVPASSGDSSSWMGAGRWGNGAVFIQRTGGISAVSVYSAQWMAWRALIEKRYPQTFEFVRAHCHTDKHRVYFGNAAVSIYAYWMMMEHIHGQTIEAV